MILFDFFIENTTVMFLIFLLLLYDHVCFQYHRPLAINEMIG